MFGARTSIKYERFLFSRSKVGDRAAIHLPDAQARCYVYITGNKIGFAVLADDQYPDRVAYMILRKLSLEFSKDFEGKNFAIMESKLFVISEDENVKWEKLEVYIKKFQDPKEVDKLEKLKGELEEVEKIVHKNMDDLLKRGEDLDKLMEKSKDVSNLSLDFYKNAKKTNKRCCSLY